VMLPHLLLHLLTDGFEIPGAAAIHSQRIS
jgi:hypothetical protein